MLPSQRLISSQIWWWEIFKASYKSHFVDNEIMTGNGWCVHAQKENLCGGRYNTTSHGACLCAYCYLAFLETVSVNCFSVTCMALWWNNRNMIFELLNNGRDRNLFTSSCLLLIVHTTLAHHNYFPKMITSVCPGLQDISMWAVVVRAIIILNGKICM